MTIVHASGGMELPPSLFTALAERSAVVPTQRYGMAEVAASGKLRPVPAASRGQMSFDALRLAHAVTRADLQRGSVLDPLVLSFGLHVVGCCVWRGRSLRAVDGATSILADFSRTSFVGRLAQGLAILHLDDAGYGYVAHFDAWRRVVQFVPNGVTPPSRSPDFVFSHPDGRLTLVESKGRLIGPAGKPRLKSLLREALKQLTPWRTMLPGNASLLAAASVLREEPDTRDSILTLVTDDGGDSGQGSGVQDDGLLAIQRMNYRGWFKAIGFLPDGPRPDGGQPTLGFVRIGDSRYVVRAIAIVPVRDTAPPHETGWFVPHPNGPRVVLGVLLAGMAVGALADAVPLFDDTVRLAPLLDRAIESDWFVPVKTPYISKMRDGSLLAIVPLSRYLNYTPVRVMFSP